MCSKSHSHHKYVILYVTVISIVPRDIIDYTEGVRPCVVNDFRLSPLLTLVHVWQR